MAQDALRAARAGDEAEPDLREAKLGLSRRDAQATGERELQPAASALPVSAAAVGLASRSSRSIRSGRIGAMGGASISRMSRPRHEHLRPARDDEARDGRIRLDLVERARQPLPHRRRQRVTGGLSMTATAISPCRSSLTGPDIANLFELAPARHADSRWSVRRPDASGRAVERKERKHMPDAWLVAGVRTPIGRFGGALAAVRPDDMAALVISELMARHPSLPPRPWTR